MMYRYIKDEVIKIIIYDMLHIASYTSVGTLQYICYIEIICCLRFHKGCREISVRQTDGGNKCPQVQCSTHPTRDDLDPKCTPCSLDVFSICFVRSEDMNIIKVTPALFK